MPREFEVTPSKRILLIKDDVDLAASAYDYLEADGFVIDSVLDGVTGLNLANTRVYEAIDCSRRYQSVAKLRGGGALGKLAGAMLVGGVLLSLFLLAGMHLRGY